MQTIKQFDYWAFHRNGSVQFYRIREGEVADYREYDRVEDAPVLVLDPELRYHGQSYLVPA